jgi:hypothetical protein
MSDIEKRLKALEKRIPLYEERWHATKAHVKALSMAIDCIGEPICQVNPRLISMIIKNLKTFEKEAKLQNGHSVLIWQLRETRKFFEARVPKRGQTDPNL